MAYVNPKKKLNRFRRVSIPSNKDLFYRVGKRPIPAFEDGQIANFNGDTMSMLDNAIDVLLKDNQMPLDTK